MQENALGALKSSVRRHLMQPVVRVTISVATKSVATKDDGEITRVEWRDAETKQQSDDFESKRFAGTADQI